MRRHGCIKRIRAGTSAEQLTTQIWTMKQAGWEKQRVWHASNCHRQHNSSQAAFLNDKPKKKKEKKKLMSFYVRCVDTCPCGGHGCDGDGGLDSASVCMSFLCNTAGTWVRLTPPAAVGFCRVQILHFTYISGGIQQMTDIRLRVGPHIQLLCDWKLTNICESRNLNTYWEEEKMTEWAVFEIRKLRLQWIRKNKIIYEHFSLSLYDLCLITNFEMMISYKRQVFTSFCRWLISVLEPIHINMHIQVTQV